MSSNDIEALLEWNDHSLPYDEQLAQARKALYEAVVLCVPGRKARRTEHSRGFNDCSDETFTNLAELFGMGNLAMPQPTNSQPQLADNLHFDPYDFVEPCEPDCSPERHAYHQGQWDMAGRINKAAGISKEGDTE